MNVVAVRMGCDIDSNNLVPDMNTFRRPNEFANVYSNRFCAYSCEGSDRTEILKKRTKKKEFSLNIKLNYDFYGVRITSDCRVNA